MTSLSTARGFFRLRPPLPTKARPHLLLSVLKWTSVSRSHSLAVRAGTFVPRAIASSTASSVIHNTHDRYGGVWLRSERMISNRLVVKRSSLRCKYCQKSFESNGGIIDLTISTDAVAPLGTSFFQNPLIAFVYERGYRDVFGIFNFPGFDEEARRAQELLQSARGDVIMDLSCGPGAFTRRFLASGDYATVIAADYSKAMLEQCRGFLENESSADLSNVVLVRADAGRLPFATSSLAGVHAAAAIHCWPDVTKSVAEISRVLRPGGVFVASTFLIPTPTGLEEPLKPVRQALDQLQLTFAWFTEAELKEVTEACGLIDWYSYRRGVYLLFSASKPK